MVQNMPKFWRNRGFENCITNFGVQKSKKMKKMRFFFFVQNTQISVENGLGACFGWFEGVLGSKYSKRNCIVNYAAPCIYIYIYTIIIDIYEGVEGAQERTSCNFYSFLS